MEQPDLSFMDAVLLLGIAQCLYVIVYLLFPVWPHIPRRCAFGVFLPSARLLPLTFLESTPSFRYVRWL